MEELTDDEDADPVAGDQDHLHHLPPPLEILTDHQSGAVPAQTHSNTYSTSSILSNRVERSLSPWIMPILMNS